MTSEKKLKGALAEKIENTPRLKGSLSEKALATTVSYEDSASILRGKGLEIAQAAEGSPPQTYRSIKNGKRYKVIEFRKRSERGLEPIVRLQCLDDISIVNLAASALEDPERFALEG